MRYLTHLDDATLCLHVQDRYELLSRMITYYTYNFTMPQILNIHSYYLSKYPISKKSQFCWGDGEIPKKYSKAFFLE